MSNLSNTDTACQAVSERDLADSQDTNTAAASAATAPGWHIATYDKPGMAETFPLDAFPPLLRDVADNLATVYQVPPSLPAMSALAVLSGAIGKAAHVLRGYKDKKTRLNIALLKT